MNLKSEKGATGVDIAISIIILSLFIGLIVSLMYGISQTSKDIERKSEATNYAISEIEKLKAEDFETLESKQTSGYIEDTPYYKTIKVVDYADLEENKGQDKEPGLVKKVTVEIAYKSGKEDKKVELSTVLSKEK
mgnify:CR=1 FL=1